MRIGILGQLEVRGADGQLLPVGGARLRSFVIRLAASEGGPVSVDRLAEDLWPREQPADAANAVQALASRVRAAAGRDLIEFGPAGYRIAVAAGQVDAWAFERQIAAARTELESGRSDIAAGQFREALQLWRGPALADVADAPWAAATIARLSELRLAALEDRIDADLALGRGAELVPEVEELATEHPLRERLRGQLMRSLYAAGRQADALAVFEDTRRALETSLGIDPSPGLAAVHLAVLRGELPAGPLPWQAAEDGSQNGGSVSDDLVTGPGAGRNGAAGGRNGNLPAQLTSFVGRDDELSRVAKLLDESRLISLTGPGGAGKTRLAIEAGARLDAADGVWFVPLAPVRDALDVPQAVLAAIGAHEMARVSGPEAARLAALSPLDRLCELLAARDLVLVLDNCEHLLDAAASLAVAVLAGAPGVRILTTSREPLGVTGETLSPVPSLQLPAEDADPAELAGNPAVRLFADRAAAVRPGFVVNDDTAAAVVAICRALDGIPLAIELAAARVRALTPAQVADRLADRFALLSVASRGTLPRHQTLRAIVDWSWELLDDAERAVLRRLSVFSGGATPESAEQVCLLAGGQADGGGDAAADGRDVVDIIASLLDKSLVTAGGERHVRYRLLETVRAYAAERLAEAGETGPVAAAHARYFLDLAERAEPKLRSREQLTWLQLLSAEHDNFAAALRHSAQAGDAGTMLRLVAALAWYWITHDYDAEAAEWAVAAVRLAPAEVPDDLADAHALCRLMSVMAGMRDADLPIERLHEVLGGLLERAGASANPMLALVAPMLAAMTGDASAFDAGMDKASAHPDPWVRAARRLASGHLAINSGDLDTAGSELAVAYDSFELLGDRFGMMVSRSGLAELAMADDRPADAVRSLEEARSLAVEGIAGNWAETVRVALGRARAAAGDVAGGRAEIEAAVRFAERIGELDDAVQGYVYLSDLARSAGDLTEARALLERAADIIRPRQLRPDLRFQAASTFSKLGCVAEQEGDLDAAAGWHRQALALLRDPPVVLLASNQVLAVVVEGVAALTAARGDHARAAELLGLAHTLQGYRNAASLEVRRTEAASTLSESEFKSAYASGRLLGQPDAFALSF